MNESMADAQSSSHYEVSIDRWALWRVLDMPGLARIELQSKIAVLTFETAPGCEPAGLEFVASEVQQMSGGHVLEAHERCCGKLPGYVSRDAELTERLRTENLALVDAMRDARSLLHKPRPRAMAAAAMLGSALEARMLAMLPEEGDDADA